MDIDVREIDNSFVITIVLTKYETEAYLGMPDEEADRVLGMYIMNELESRS